jgi:hypothetical protein
MSVIRWAEPPTQDTRRRGAFRLPTLPPIDSLAFPYSAPFRLEEFINPSFSPSLSRGLGRKKTEEFTHGIVRFLPFIKQERKKSKG